MRRLTRRSSISLRFPEDEKPNTTSSFTTKFSLRSFTRRVEKLTNDQRTAISRVGFGNLLNIHNQLLSRSLLGELMDRWDCEKLAFMLLPGEITITLRDVALILGLRVIGKPVLLNEEEPFLDLEQQYGATAVNRSIDISLIEEKLESMGEDADEDFVRSFILFTFGVFLFPNASGKVTKVDSGYLSFLRDMDKVDEFAWGEAVLQDLVRWLSKRKEDKMQCVGGCLLLLQVWFYEHINIGRPKLRDSSNFPRSCRWESNRRFYNKFNELEEDQITWILQPSREEAKINVLKELLESESPRQDHLTEEPSPSSSLLIEELLQSESPKQVHITEEPSHPPLIEVKDSIDTCSLTLAEVADSIDYSHPTLNDHVNDLKYPSDVEVKDSLDLCSLSVAEVADSLDSSHPTVNDHLDKRRIESDGEVDSAVNHQQEHVSATAEASPRCQNEYSKDLPYSTRLQPNGSLGDLIFMGKTTESNELCELREENAVLKDQIRLLQEENVKLKEENEELRRMSDDVLVDRLESLFDEYDEGLNTEKK